ncbi:MAG: cupredoxin family protein [Betaproteobacteria bacterium]|nr:cupredoxin family protein [Betaproteobacteria bacterium]
MRLLFLILGIALSHAALAHGEKAHAVPEVDYSKAEKKPFGIATDPRKAKRTIRVEMSDAMRFTPADIEVRRGETVRFVAANKGQVLHEMVLGTMDDLNKHADLMKRFPGMEHDELHTTHVAPGQRGEIGWRFTNTGTYYFGCLIPGHFEAGMIGKITVTP